MRLVALSLSTVLLSGCSWLGGLGGSNNAYQYKQNPYAQGAPAHMGAQGGQNRCVIFSPVQPVPTGCHPSQVVVSGQHGNVSGQPSYATGGYGSHVGEAQRVAAHASDRRGLRKPKLRGTVSFGTETSVAGNLLTPNGSSFLYDPALFDEGYVNGTADLITTTQYTSAVENISAPALSFTDVHQSPLSLKGGVEYIVNPNFTLFANGGFTHASGANDASATVVATLLKTVTEQPLDPATGNPLGTPIVNTQFIPNQEVANLVADFSDHRQYDLELGARRYFAPISQEQGFRTLTPFVGASVGLSRVNDITFKSDQTQLFLERAFENGEFEYYDVPTAGDVNTLYESDWLVNGALTAGIEYQLTPKTALAFETGLKAYQDRSFVSGDSGDMNVVVPLTLRGSYNF